MQIAEFLVEAPLSFIRIVFRTIGTPILRGLLIHICNFLEEGVSFKLQLYHPLFLPIPLFDRLRQL